MVGSDRAVAVERSAEAVDAVDAVVDLVRAARGGDAAQVTAAGRDPQWRTLHLRGSATYLLGAWHVATMRAEFGVHPDRSDDYLDRVLAVADRLDRWGRHVADVGVGEVLDVWLDQRSVAARSTAVVDEQDVLVLAASVAESLCARRLSAADAEAEFAEVAFAAVPDRGAGGPFSWSTGVAMQLMRLSLTPSGLLRTTDLHESVVRAALLVDLQTAGRLEQTDPVNLVDTAPTGFAAVDAFLAAVDAHPGRSVHDAVARGPKPTRTLAAMLVATGRWERAGGHWSALRFTVADDEHAVLLARWRRYGFIADGDLPGSVTEATLAGLALLGRLIPGRKDQPSEA